MNQQKLKELLHYDPDTGFFTWLPRQDKSFNTRFSGKMAGYLRWDGYRIIKIRGYGNSDNEMQYSASRLAWLYQTGSWPSYKYEIDHINKVPSDDRFLNLRIANRSENASNRGLQSNNTSGIKGVYQKNDKWYARIYKDRIFYHIGVFETAEQAYEAYLKKGKSLHGEFFTP